MPAAFRSDPRCLEHFVRLDDNDVWSSSRCGPDTRTRYSSTLSAGMVDRRLLKVEIAPVPFGEERKQALRQHIASQLGIGEKEARYFVCTADTERDMYNPSDDTACDILYADGTTKNIAEASDMLNIALLSKKGEETLPLLLAHRAISQPQAMHTGNKKPPQCQKDKPKQGYMEKKSVL